MSRLLTRIAIALALLLASLSWATGPTHLVHASGTDVVTDCVDRYTVTNPGKPDEVVTHSPGTLRYVVEHASAGDTITFACTGPIVSVLGVIYLVQNLTIDGGGQGMTLNGGACGLGLF